jgi:hypothetical protein
MPMVEDDQQRDLSIELARTRTELESLRAQSATADMRYYDARQQSPASTALSSEASENPAVAVLEHIYRDMIAALRQMYRDTIEAKDDALAGRDRELETKDALIEHLRKRADEAEARASQALRYIGELDQLEAHATSKHAAEQAPNPPAKRRGVARLFGK